MPYPKLSPNMKKALIIILTVVIFLELFLPKVHSDGISFFRFKVTLVDSKSGEKLKDVQVSLRIHSDQKSRIHSDQKTDILGNVNFSVAAGYSRDSTLLFSRHSASLYSEEIKFTKEGYKDKTYLIPEKEFKWYFIRPKLPDITLEMEKG